MDSDSPDSDSEEVSVINKKRPSRRGKEKSSRSPSKTVSGSAGMDDRKGEPSGGTYNKMSGYPTSKQSSRVGSSESIGCFGSRDSVGGMISTAVGPSGSSRDGDTTPLLQNGNRDTSEVSTTSPSGSSQGMGSSIHRQEQGTGGRDDDTCTVTSAVSMDDTVGHQGTSLVDGKFGESYPELQQAASAVYSSGHQNLRKLSHSNQQAAPSAFHIVTPGSSQPSSRASSRGFSAVVTHQGSEEPVTDVLTLGHSDSSGDVGSNIGVGGPRHSAGKRNATLVVIDGEAGDVTSGGLTHSPHLYVDIEGHSSIQLPENKQLL